MSASFPDVQYVGDGIGLLGHAVDELFDHGFHMDESLRMMREKLVRRALDRTAGNITAAGRLLGRHRNTLTRELEELGLTDLPARIREARRHEPVQEALPFCGISLVPPRTFSTNSQFSHKPDNGDDLTGM